MNIDTPSPFLVKRNLKDVFVLVVDLVFAK